MCTSLGHHLLRVAMWVSLKSTSNYPHTDFLRGKVNSFDADDDDDIKVVFVWLFEMSRSSQFFSISPHVVWSFTHFSSTATNWNVAYTPHDMFVYQILLLRNTHLMEAIVLVNEWKLGWVAYTKQWKKTLKFHNDTYFFTRDYLKYLMFGSLTI